MPISVTLTPTNPQCPTGANTCDGSITSATSGGNAPYTYSWTKNGIPFATTKDINYLCEGYYRVVVTDSTPPISGGAQTTTADATLEAPAAINPHAFIRSAKCYEQGSIALSPTGGTAPYSYLWSTGNISSLLTDDAGTYGVTITDDNNCSATFEFIIGGFAPFTVLIESMLEKCFEGEIELKALPSNGTAPFTYSWDSGETTQAIQAEAGETYIVTVTDSNGCEAITQVTVPTQSQSYLCCLSDKIFSYVNKLKNGLKNCGCKQMDYLTLNSLIGAYERMVTPLNGIIASQLSSSSSQDFGRSSSSQRFLLQSFVAPYDCIANGVFVIPDTSSGIFTTTLTLWLREDLNGVPSTVIAQKNITNAAWTASIGLEFFANFTALPQLTSGSTYWIEVAITLPSNTNYANIKTSGAVSDDVFIGWTGAAVPTVLQDTLYFKVCANALPDCLDSDQQQIIKDQLTQECGCCTGCDDLPQKTLPIPDGGG